MSLLPIVEGEGAGALRAAAVLDAGEPFGELQELIATTPQVLELASEAIDGQHQIRRVLAAFEWLAERVIQEDQRGTRESAAEAHRASAAG